MEFASNHLRMGWFVRRNGETVGPVEPAILAGWVRDGMLDADIREDGSSEWLPVRRSPFHLWVPKRRGLGCGAWTLLGLGSAATIGACYAAPPIGWTGWLVIGGAFAAMKHFENQAAIRAELAEMNGRRR